MTYKYVFLVAAAFLPALNGCSLHVGELKDADFGIDVPKNDKTEPPDSKESGDDVDFVV